MTTETLMLTRTARTHKPVRVRVKVRVSKLRLSSRQETKHNHHKNLKCQQRIESPKRLGSGCKGPVT